ncbi:unnamed protein product [Gongylonema pulchrum]|uniref:DB domain-containing protein n=1 Tax=Gongylonema pulchrum TaxID=637853 RepID=A0A183D7F4_9BILA|nr:unnamed protein product [Gongylonema pulchrum]
MFISYVPTECGTIDAEFAPCVGKKTADQLFYDCCKLYIEPECHDLCQYEVDRDAAQSLVQSVFRFLNTFVK